MKGSNTIQRMFKGYGLVSRESCKTLIWGHPATFHTFRLAKKFSQSTVTAVYYIYLLEEPPKDKKGLREQRQAVQLVMALSSLPKYR